MLGDCDAMKSNEVISRLYRSVLRSSASAVRFSRPATLNSRRYLRDDLAHELKLDKVDPNSARHAQLRHYAETTSAFHLSSAISARELAEYDARYTAFRSDRDRQTEAVETQTIDTATEKSQPVVTHARYQVSLPHRVISNLASLTYHHLSPNTRMQKKPVRLPEAKKSKPATSVKTIARVLAKREQAASSENDGETSPSLSEGDYRELLGDRGFDANVLRRCLSFLQPSPKARRGPFQSRSPSWNGQDFAKLESPGVLAVLQEDLDILQDVERRLSSRDTMTYHAAPSSKVLQKMRDEIAQIQVQIKGKLTRAKQRAETEQFEAISIDMLANLVSSAQSTEKLWIGQKRWLARQRNDFLPP